MPKLPPKSPAHSEKHDLHHRHSWSSLNGHASPGHRLARKGSAASLASLSSTDGAGSSRSSSRASSVASRADCESVILHKEDDSDLKRADKERVKELDQERIKEREREWNKPHPKLSRSSSSLSLNKSER